MRAIVVNEANLPKILQTDDLSVLDAQKLSDLADTKARRYYFIQGYYDRRNRLVGWSFIPENVFVDTFDFDPENILTNWDEIVRL